MTVILCLLFFVIGFIVGVKFKSHLISFFLKLRKAKNEEDTYYPEKDEEEVEDFEDSDLKMVFLVRDDLKL